MVATYMHYSKGWWVQLLGRYRLLYLVNAKVVHNTRILLQYYVYVGIICILEMAGEGVV